MVGDDDTGAAEYAEELDLGHPVASASERVWRNYAAREPGLVVLVAQGGDVVRGWPSPPTEAVLADALDELIAAVRRAATLASALLAAGCGGGSAEVDARLAIVVPDNNIRAEGEECAGATPFRAIHRSTAFTIEDGAGAVVAEGELPTGRATNANPDVDWESDRFPTVCVFEVEVGLPERARFRLVLPETLPVEFERAARRRAAPARASG